MKLHIVSDIHIDHCPYNSGSKSFFPFHPRLCIEQLFNDVNKDESILLVAGDLSNGNSLPLAQMWLTEMSKWFKAVIFIAGNHDYWGNNFARTNKVLKSYQSDNVHYLNNNAIAIDGQRFVGTTLWPHWQSENPIYEYQMPDFEFLGQAIYKENEKAEKFLYDNVQDGDVVLSHHMPDRSCVAPGYLGSPMNRFFLTQLDPALIKRAKLWHFGHTHNHRDFMLDNCHMICNPLGYPHEYETSGYVPTMIEI